MQNKYAVWVGVLIAIVIAIGAYYYPSVKNLGGATAGTTTNLPSLGLAKLVVGTGCDDSFTSCTSGLTVNGSTTTIANSYAGIEAYGTFTMATGTVKAIYTNSYGPMMCDSGSGSLYVKAATFMPSLIFSLGTSTSATGYSTNLLASSTVATSTTQVWNLTSSRFVLNSGDSIIGAISDTFGSGGAASSTYYANSSAEFSVRCWLLH